ncbi:MAG: gamma-glutamyl-gamma-aminobutyrate hydrolase family protein [Verrucomicrobiota bacterium]
MSAAGSSPVTSSPSASASGNCSRNIPSPDMPTALRPLILVAASPHANGAEFDDRSTSLSMAYTDAVLAAGGLPWIFPPTPDVSALREALGRCDGVLLTGATTSQRGCIGRTPAQSWPRSAWGSMPGGTCSRRRCWANGRSGRCRCWRCAGDCRC